MFIVCIFQLNKALDESCDSFESLHFIHTCIIGQYEIQQSPNRIEPSKHPSCFHSLFHIIIILQTNNHKWDVFCGALLCSLLGVANGIMFFAAHLLILEQCIVGIKNKTLNKLCYYRLNIWFSLDCSFLTCNRVVPILTVCLRENPFE